MAQTSYNNLMSQISKLQAQAEQARKKEMQIVIQDIQKQMKIYNIEPKDLASHFALGRGRRSKTAQQNATPVLGNSKTTNQRITEQSNVKFRHPETGATWSGRGRMPKWISQEVKQGRTKQDFAIS